MKRENGLPPLVLTLLLAAVLAAGCSNDEPVPPAAATPTPAFEPTAALQLTATAPITVSTPAPVTAGEPTAQLDVSIWAPLAGFLEKQTLQQNADVLDEVNFFRHTLGAGGGIEGGIMAAQAAQDWARLGAAVDAFKIMTYDFHNGASAAGPIAPLDWVDAVLRYAATVVPPEKTSMGVPVYGYNWTGSRAQGLNWRQALQLAEQQGAQPQRDPASGELTFSYDDGRHTVWFNDGQTLAARLALLREKHPGVAGIAIWPLGGEDPANWTAIRAAAD